MLNIKPVIRHLSITRHSQHDQMYIQLRPGRVMSIVPDCMPVKYNFCEKSAIKTLNRLADVLRKNGQIVHVDDTIPA